MPDRPVALAVAGGVCLIGVVAAVVVVWRPGPQGSPARPLNTAPSEAVLELPRPSAMELEVGPTTLGVVVDTLAQRSGDLMRADPLSGSLGASAAESLASELRQLLPPYLGGSFDSYRAYAGGLGARFPEAGDDASAWEAFEPTWKANGESVALRPVSAEHMIVRLRWKEGKAVPQPKSGAIVETAVADARFDVPRDAERGRLTVVEVMIPVMFFSPPRTLAPAYWSIWLAWDQPSGRWKIWQFQFYDVDRLGGLYGPVY